jgi:metal-responsive CopG/Arc/MetJ family transcriptional regulator
MKTIQMTLDDDLVSEVDNAARKLHTSRSAFTRRALREALRALAMSRLEQKHRKGYLDYPATPNEFGVAEKERAWGDTW